MIDPSLGLLIERLHWPVQRVRWEAARGLAKLIRAGAEGVFESLTQWTAGRSLESECLLGLSVIHAFDLGDLCPEDKVRRAVSKPSLASDWMLRTIYNTHERGASFRYAVSPRTPALLDEDAAVIFDQFNTSAVPRVFLHTLERLEDALDFPFVDRWRHDWAWICRSYGVRVPESGFFRGSDQERGAPLDLPQGEMLVSAYLRTLAYAMHTGKLAADQAEHHAMLALPMNRGLAGLEPVPRPAWSRNLAQRWRDSGRALTNELWTQAECSARPGEMPAALRLTEGDDKDFIEVQIDLVAGHGAFDARKPSAESPQCAWAATEPGCMAGDIRLGEGALGPVTGPLTSACLVAPRHVGRVDATVALEVRLACLGLGWRRGRVRCQPDAVELHADGEVVSRWHHWYANWEPSRFTQQDSNVSGMTTVRRSWLRAYVQSSAVSVALLVRVQVGTREHTHQDHTVDVDKFWISPQASGTVAIPDFP